MSCDAVAASVYLWLAASGGAGQALPITLATTAAPMAVAEEPLFADIVRRAGALKSEVDGLIAAGAPAPDRFRADVRALADLDMQGHLTLAKRGVDGDLKCILRGIAQDLPVKLRALDAAVDSPARAVALKEMGYLLNDNIEVITAPPAPPV